MTCNFILNYIRAQQLELSFNVIGSLSLSVLRCCFSCSVDEALSLFGWEEHYWAAGFHC